MNASARSNPRPDSLVQSIHILSPHRDDAIFSLFFCISEWLSRGASVSVTNFFTQSAYGPHSGAHEPSIVTDIRMREDRRALKRIGTCMRVRDCGLIDAPLRLQIPAAKVCYTEAREADVELVCGALPRIRADLVLSPLGLGGHVDHVTVRRAALQSIPSFRLAFYEDLPYAMWSESQLPGILASIEAKLGSRLKPRIVRSSQTISAKRTAAASYRSQIMHDEADAMAKWSRRYGVGERIWASAKRRFPVARA